MNEALRQEWVRAGYSRNMGSAAVVSPPPESFLRVYHITSAEFGISNIGLSRMKVARFLDLNDPFELMAMNFREQSIERLSEISEAPTIATQVCFASVRIGRILSCGAIMVRSIVACASALISGEILHVGCATKTREYSQSLGMDQIHSHLMRIFRRHCSVRSSVTGSTKKKLEFLCGWKTPSERAICIFGHSTATSSLPR